MTFWETLTFAAGLLFIEKRVSYKRLRKQLDLDDDTLEILRDELIVKRLAVDENGIGLVALGADSELGWAPASAEHLRPNLATAPTDAGESSATPQEAERRQLTVMFCDLVGSTALSTRLDPEDLREVMACYQDACRGAIEHYEGFVARYMGDGMLVYFGYPQAHENDAERAIRTGLDILETMPTVSAQVAASHGVEVAVRVGVSTGPVVVGDIVGEGAAEEAAVVGETPNLAARLEGVAEPGQMVIGPGTHRLVERLFEFEDLGKRELKGLATPVRVWRVTGERSVDDASEEWRATHTPLVGRQEELGLLTRAWESTRESRGQIVLMQGDAGVGKTRLLDALRSSLADEPHTWISVRASPYHTASPLYPVAEQVRRALDWEVNDTDEARLRRLEGALSEQTDFSLEEIVPVFASFLSIEMPPRYPPIDTTPNVQREATLDGLSAWILGLTNRAPVLMVWEDLHWADPTTVELLGLMLDQVPTAPILMVGTFRPEFVPPWPSRAHVTPISLARLDRPEIEAIATNLASGKALPENVLNHIVDKADGVPLYVEELTKAILDSELLTEEANRFSLSGSLADVRIPETLQDSLMARLDRVPLLRELAQIGSVIGREFSYEALQSLVPQEERVLQEALNQLVANELLYQRGRGRRARYMFKHALIHEAAYQSLLNRSRQHYHLQVAKLFEEQFANIVESEPEFLAHHYSEAGHKEEAMKYWHLAGRVAAQRSANAEAIVHLRHGLNNLEGLAATDEHDRLELAILRTLGSATIATEGFGAAEVRKIYQRAKSVSDRVGDAVEQFSVQRGLWNSYLFSGQLQLAKVRGEELVRLAEDLGDSSLMVEAYRVMGTVTFALGELETARRYTNDGIRIYDPEHHRDLALVYGADPGMACHCYGAVVLWLLGYPEQAESAIHEALLRARELSQGHGEAITSWFHSLLGIFLRDPDTAFSAADTARELSSKFSIQQFVIWGSIYRGWARSAEGGEEEGLNEIKEAIQSWNAMGNRYLASHFNWLLADALFKHGRISEALEVVDAAFPLIEDTSEEFMLAEFHRLRGELLLSQAPAKPDVAEAEFELALAVARKQGAKSLELRASTSLSRLLFKQGKLGEARARLAPIYDWFTEGFDTGDLQDARAILCDLQQAVAD